MKIELKQVEDACKEIYIRALKLLPPDIKEGFKRLDASETDRKSTRLNSSHRP